MFERCAGLCARVAGHLRGGGGADAAEAHAALLDRSGALCATAVRVLSESPEKMSALAAEVADACGETALACESDPEGGPLVIQAGRENRRCEDYCRHPPAYKAAPAAGGEPADDADSAD